MESKNFSIDEKNLENSNTNNNIVENAIEDKKEKLPTKNWMRNLSASSLTFLEDAYNNGLDIEEPKTRMIIDLIKTIQENETKIAKKYKEVKKNLEDPIHNKYKEIKKDRTMETIGFPKESIKDVNKAMSARKAQLINMTNNDDKVQDVSAIPLGLLFSAITSYSATCTKSNLEQSEQHSKFKENRFKKEARDTFRKLLSENPFDTNKPQNYEQKEESRSNKRVKFEDEKNYDEDIINTKSNNKTKQSIDLARQLLNGVNVL